MRSQPEQREQRNDYAMNEIMGLVFRGWGRGGLLLP